MNKKFICFLISGTPISIQTLAEELVQCTTEELKSIAQLLENEYGITMCKAERQDLKTLFEEFAKKQAETNTLVFQNKPNFPIPDDLFKRQRGKQFFPPPKMGKISSKPKGKFRK